jgi:hypothetical protein
LTLSVAIFRGKAGGLSRIDAAGISNLVARIICGVRTRAEIEIAGRRIASGLVHTDGITGDDAEDTELLKEMTSRATRYIESFSWCDAVLDTYFGGGVGGIFAVFFFRIQPSRAEVDPWIWVMVGDVPSAYLPLTNCESPAEAFRMYLDGMSRWVELARDGKTGTAEEGVPPVNVPATPEWAEKLNLKLSGLASIIKPFFEEDEDGQEVIH